MSIKKMEKLKGDLNISTGIFTFGLLMCPEFLILLNVVCNVGSVKFLPNTSGSRTIFLIINRSCLTLIIH